MNKDRIGIFYCFTQFIDSFFLHIKILLEINKNYLSKIITRLHFAPIKGLHVTFVQSLLIKKESPKY